MITNDDWRRAIIKALIYTDDQEIATGFQELNPLMFYSIEMMVCLLLITNIFKTLMQTNFDRF